MIHFDKFLSALVLWASVRTFMRLKITAALGQ